jgi:hypothetical protein
LGGLKKEEMPRRYHEANVFRRGKMSLELSGYEVGSGKHIDEGSGPKKKKVDYSDKIKELEHRLYNK